MIALKLLKIAIERRSQPTQMAQPKLIHKNAPGKKDCSLAAKTDNSNNANSDNAKT